MNATVRPCFLLTIRKSGQPDRRIVLPSLSDALEAARHDARWLCGIGSVLISPLLYVTSETERS